MMEIVIGQVTLTHCSFVVRLIDSYTGGSPADPQLRVRLVGWDAKPVRKPDGSFVFVGLPGPDQRGRWQVTVESDIYLDEVIEVEMDGLEPLNPVVHRLLLPRPCYPYTAGATIIRASVRDARGRGVAGIEAQATIVTPECYKARLAQDTDENARERVELMQRTGGVVVGSRFLLVGKEGEPPREICEIAEVISERSYRLKDPLSTPWRRGTWLLPITWTRSDERGELALYLPFTRRKSFQVIIEVAAQVKEVDVEEGTMTALGSFCL
ncbi:hypothetical protein [Brevibacillus dissolubilis]|uniref:hypothetical protein n=1 Tax=Brevibacillus dissolubilis TaxID=1844116 RepID=UPI0011168C48|nr:hypothetical protein [Brevibacillus dissolubilis]